MQADKLALQHHISILAKTASMIGPLQSTKAENHAYGELGVTVQLDVPEKWNRPERSATGIRIAWIVLS
jgi:hypothetical protein